MNFSQLIAQAPAPPAVDIVEDDPLEPLPDPWKNAIWIAVGILAALIIIAVIIIAVRTLMREKTRTLTAEYVTLKKLSEVETKAAALSPNEFSLQVSEIIKDFVKSRFNDPLRYETTDEFLARIAESESVSITPQVRDQLGEFLKIAEEIKFGLPPDAEAQKMPLHQKAVTIVETQRQAMREAAVAAAGRK